MLLPPLCPMAKGKKVLFVFILKILDGNRAQSGSFWEVPKKCRRCRPIKPKKPKVTPGVAPVAPKKPEVSSTAALMAQAILKKPDRVEEDAMTGVEPSVSADPPPSCPFSPLPSIPRYHSEAHFLAHNPFPHEFDCAGIEKWFRFVKFCQVPLRDISAIVRDASHTDPICLQCIHAMLVAMGLPPPPFFLSTTSS
jgi:hypothetical protein